MDFGLTGKTAIVTGAGQGIGRAITRALHAEGVATLIVGQTRAKLEQTARDCGSGAPVYPLVADLSLLAEIERVAKDGIRQLKHVDILVNCAARTKAGGFFSLSDTDIQEAWQVKGLGYIRLVRAIAPHMMERGDGRIINVVGSAARTPTADFIPGAMVNAALVNFTRGISRELARRNVRINSVSPGWTLTERQERSFEMEAMAQNVSVQHVRERAAMAIPLGRHVSMDEIAAMTLLLVSDLAPGLTGEDIIIDGGVTQAI
jgi:3-oxoacyl-[acyl-carrier protein] reductase/bacilysin biosynthesis oxidoreductase BacG